MWRKRLAISLIAILAAMATGQQPDKVVPLVNAHAHNDYAHTRPLLDALSCGLCSIEADVFLINGQLLVGHNLLDLRPSRTLAALYLDPLAARVKENGGHVYRDGPTVTLLIDVKTEPESTYAALEKILAKYESMLTVFHPDQTEPGAVSVVISGNRARATMEKQQRRLAACDGLLPDLDAAPSVHLVPLISSQWSLSFKWRGKGPMPEDEKALLRQCAQKAHAHGQRLRFWGAPDNQATWTELRAAGVDLINTDDLRGVRDFLLRERGTKNEK